MICSGFPGFHVNQLCVQNLFSVFCCGLIWDSAGFGHIRYYANVLDLLWDFPSLSVGILWYPIKFEWKCLQDCYNH